MSTTTTEKVVGRFLDNHYHFPPYALLQDYSIECERFRSQHPKLCDALYSILEVIDRLLPDNYKIDVRELYRQKEMDRSEYGMTVPLYDVIDPARVIIEILYQFYHELGDEGYEWRKKLQENENALHGISQYARRTKGVPLPTQVDLAPDDLAYAYLKGTPFELLFNSRLPFHIPHRTWASHGIILAPPGHGKTQLLGSLVAEFLNDDRAPGLFVLDPHGDLFNTLRQRVSGDRLVVLDPDTQPPPLNFLDFGNSTEAQTLQTFSYLMSSLSGGLSDKQGALVPYLLKLLRRIPNASLDTLRLIVDEKVKTAEKSQFWGAIQSLPLVDQGFFQHQFYHSSFDPTKQAIGWKLYAALSNDTFRQMFTARTNSFNAARAMRERKVVLVKGSEYTLGEAGAPIFMQFIVAQAMQAAFQRVNIPPHERHLCLLIIDEAKHVFNHQTERILTECRKWNVGFLAASQLISQIPENVRHAIYGATAIKIAGPVADSDAEQLRKEMYCTKEFIREMGTTADGAEWAIHVSPEKKCNRVYVPYGVLEKMPKQRGGPSNEAPPSRPVPAETGAHEATKTLPLNAENTSKPRLSDIELVITTATRFEDFLTKNLGAKGIGLHQQVQSIKGTLPPHLLRPLFRIAKIRNQIAHTHNFVLYGRTRAAFIRYTKIIDDYYSKQPQPKSPDDHTRPVSE